MDDLLQKVDIAAYSHRKLILIYFHTLVNMS